MRATRFRRFVLTDRRKALRALLLLACLLTPAMARAQCTAFTIPSNDTSGIAGNPQSIWMQADIDTLVAGVNGNGVSSGLCVTPQVSPNMTVAVSSGVVKIGGINVTVSGANVTISTASATYPRVDLITANTSAALTDVVGSPAQNAGAPQVPANSAVLAMVYIPALSTAITSKQIVSKRVIPPQFTATANTVSVTDYGAVCDGSTDDSTAINAAALAVLPSGTVLFPAKTCAIASTVVAGDISGSQNTSFVSLRGVSAASSTLLWTGSTSGTALRLAKDKYMTVADLGIRNNGSVGTTVGIEQGGNSPSPSGTQTLAATFQNVSVSGFATGILGGGHNGASSEIVYVNLTLTNNTVGWNGNDFNTLDHVFIELSCSGNGVCVAGGAASNFTVLGGSASADTVADFTTGEPGTYVVQGFRSENSNRLFTADGGSVALSSVLILSPSNADKTSVDGTYVGLSVRDVNSDGAITMGPTGYTQTAVIANSRLYSLSATAPITQTSAGGSITVAVTATQFHDPNNGSPDFIYPDMTGSILPTDISGSTTPVFYPLMQTMRTDQTTTEIDWLALRRLKMLALGSIADGRNLRDQAVFSTSNTLSYTFKRDVTVSINSDIITATSGTFRYADLGKTIVLVGIVGESSDTMHDGTNAIAFITAYTDSTHVHMAPHNNYFGCCNSQTGVTVHIGENEPDGNYLIYTACSAQETVSWASPSTTGFTLTSSNATSTATCNIFIVR